MGPENVHLGPQKRVKKTAILSILLKIHGKIGRQMPEMARFSRFLVIFSQFLAKTVKTGLFMADSGQSGQNWSKQLNLAILSCFGQNG